MATYTYVIQNEKGKEIKKTIDSESKSKALVQLKGEGKFVLSLEETGALSKDVNIDIFPKKPKVKELAVFCRQFVSIINAGVPVVTALGMLVEQVENKMLAKAILDSKESIESGETLSDSMAMHPSVFPEMLITMVHAGEISGSLDISFIRMAEQFEKSSKLQASVKKASIYPAVIAIVATIVIIGMLLFVIPTFEEMLTSMDMTLPAVTVMVLNASDFLLEKWFVVLGVTLVTVAVLKTYARTNNGKYVGGLITLRLPLVKVLVTKITSAKLTRTLSTLLAAGVPLMQSLEIVAGTINNVHFKKAILKTRDEISVGSSLSEPLKQCGLFPPLVYQMINIGEETGGLENMLTKIADYFDDEVEATTDQMMALMEPLIIVLMAVVVGVVIGAVMAPMAEMYVGLDSI